MANQILELLREQNLATDDVLNQRIEAASSNGAVVSLFDLFLNRKYKSGLNFLLFVC